MSDYNDQPDPAEIPPVWGRPAAASGQPMNVDPTGIPIDPAGAALPASADGKKRMSTMAKTLTAVGVAAVIAVGGTIAVTSANASSSSSSQQGGPGGSRMGAPGGTDGMGGTGETGAAGGQGSATDTTGTARGGRGGFGEMAVIGSALHGEFVVADGTGTVTERIQTGALTAVSSTSITVRSTDDFSATYVVGSGLDVSTYTAGTDVTVIAKVSGTTVTATSVTAARTTGSTTGGTGSGSTGDMGSAPGGQSGPGSTGTGSGSTVDSGSTDSGQPTI